MNRRKSYRIEAEHAETSVDTTASQRHGEIMEAIATLRETIIPTQEVSRTLLEDHRRELHEAQRLKVEMDAIAEAIQRTKQEIATLHYAGAQGREMARVTDELGAIVLGTETATHSILAAAEKIDELTGNLTSRLTGHDREIANEIAEQVIGIFEACNFQDITGQRISKVVSAMRFVDERVGQMIQIWGGLESFRGIDMLDGVERTGDKALLNGPALAQDDGCTSQDDIDALFG
jgi:chemotaxis protein CheZ